MNEKQQQLTFDKGITNVPSDALCSDNTLQDCVGMVYDNGEHRPIQKPETYMTGLGEEQKILYVHTRNNIEHYIIRDANSIKWGTKSAENVYVPAKVEQSGQMVDVVLFTASGDVQVTSIGKTLVFTDNNGLHYFKFEGSGYKGLTFPMPNMNFRAKMVSKSDNINVVTNTGNPEGIIECNYPDYGFYIKGGKQEDFNNLIIGLYSENKKEAAQSNAFIEPFFVRAALEMYDGTYTYITNPILMYPSVTDNTRFFIFYERQQISEVGVPRKIVAATNMPELFIAQLQDYSDYSDIIKDVVIFASKGISLYNTAIDQDLQAFPSDNIIGDSVYSDFDLVFGTEPGPSLYRPIEYNIGGISGLVVNGSSKCLVNRPQKDIKKDIEETSVFYKIASIGLKPTAGFESVNSLMESGLLENLETQESLKYDDYYSRNRLIPKISYAYNSRLNLANVSRGFFNGYSYFMPFDHDDSDTNEYMYTFDVTIRTDTGYVVVRAAGVTRQKQGIYFFYPDSRATHVKIYRSVWGGEKKLILDEDLKEHPGLNGAYYFSGFTPTTDEPTGTVIERIPNIPEPEPELLYNNIIQSEVNNPWVFLAEGYHTVGTGKIIGLSTITQALSEGQFGQYPLLVFSESGIWGMSVDGKGVYSSMYPMSREICNNPASITQTDGAVFFSSEKGLMCIVGNDVRLVSPQLKSDFIKFLGNLQTFIAYDYRDSLLWIANPTSTFMWIYNIKDGTFSKYSLSGARTSVSDYPDTLIQTQDSCIFSLLKRPQQEDDENTYSGIMETRPMKLENALALKSIMQIRHILQFHPYTKENGETHETETKRGTMTLHIYASNNLDTEANSWVELHSLRGTPWKYYKFRYEFSGLKATDRFAGTMLITQERRTNKLR